MPTRAKQNDREVAQCMNSICETKEKLVAMVRAIRSDLLKHLERLPQKRRKA